MDNQFGLNYDEVLSHKISAIDAVYKNLSLQNPSVLQCNSRFSQILDLARIIAKWIPFINFSVIKFKQLKQITELCTTSTDPWLGCMQIFDPSRRQQQ